MTEKNKVTLYVYDISNGMARNFSPMLIGKVVEGIWHTSIVAYGVEYFFGGGICQAFPKSTPYGYPVKEFSLGQTEIPKDLFEEYLNEIDGQYTINTYDILKNNCNHFTDHIAQFLTGNPISDDYIKQHEQLMNTPIGNFILPMLESMSKQNNQFLPNMYEGKK
jgi:hypothetical protein